MKLIKKYILITIGACLFAAGIALFIDPNDLAPGGVSGIAILLNRVLPIETGTLILILNIPILILGIWRFGIKFILSTLYALGILSLMTNILETCFQPLTANPFLAALAGSVLTAGGMGLILKNDATTAGTDIIVKCLRMRFPHLKTGTLFFMIDMTIVLASMLVFGNIDSALYSGIAVFTTSYLLDIVLYGRDGAKLLYIVSDASEVIAGRLMTELDIGVTYLQGRGGYKNREKQVILCVIRTQTSPKALEIVKQEDPDAFLIISNATEIYGEGYKSYSNHIL